MKAFKNIVIGFLVSFLGSIPMGYLNVVGFGVYSKSGTESLILYLLGVVSVEVFVIYFTLIFASKLVSNRKLIKKIEVFSIFFMFILAYSFYSYSKPDIVIKDKFDFVIDYAPFLIGIVLSGINIVQIPFWAGWNLYLINSKYIFVGQNLEYLYIIGTLVGTFLGMFSLIFFLSYVTENTDVLSKYLFSSILPLTFIGLALIQIFSFYKKYYKSIFD